SRPVDLDLDADRAQVSGAKGPSGRERSERPERPRAERTVSGANGPSGGARVVLAAVPIAFLAVFFAWPVAAIISRGLSVRGLREVLTDPGLRSVAWFTLWQAALRTAPPIATGPLAALAVGPARVARRPPE